MTTIQAPIVRHGWRALAAARPLSRASWSPPIKTMVRLANCIRAAIGRSCLPVRRGMLSRR